MKKKIVIGFLGSQLDSGLSSTRWEKWRPTVSLAQHEDLLADRIELFYDARYFSTAQRVSEDVRQLSPHTEVRLIDMPLKNPWDFGEVYGALYDWVKKYKFNTDTEEYWAHITTGTHVAQICMFLLVEARFIPGVLVQTAPPRGRQNKGPGSYELIDLDLSRYDAINARMNVAHDDAVSFLKSGIPTRNPRFNKLIDEIEQIAVRSKAPILLSGPTGAGKSMLARRIFELKKARHQITGNFVDVNCATLRGDGASSSLFGHKRGAFTGAANERPGLLRTADQGTLFLDEIAELGPDEQAMLLKAIEEKRFLPVGSDQEVSSDFQLIAGTNKDLRQEVLLGRFREDLFARINLWSYELPSLAQRREDIEPNIDHLLSAMSRELGKNIRLNTEAREALLSFALAPEALWRGNFRDLSACVTRLATLADNGRISKEQVSAEMARLKWQWADSASEAHNSNEILRQVLGDRADALDLFERIQLQEVLKVCSRHRSLSEAGKVLFEVSREHRSVVNDSDRLRKYLLKYGLDWRQISVTATSKD
jgi:transcriptional regulatory protein RtcR